MAVAAAQQRFSNDVHWLPVDEWCAVRNPVFENDRAYSQFSHYVSEGHACSLSRLVKEWSGQVRVAVDNLWKFWCQRLANTEIHFLYLLWLTARGVDGRTKLHNFDLGKFFPDRVCIQVSLVSYFPVCNSCTIALSQSLLSRLFDMPRQRITVIARSIQSKVRFSSIWEADGNQRVRFLYP